MATRTLDPSRAARLKALTQDVHERLDRSIMAAASFSSVEGYARFAQMQYLFHRDIEALYDDARLQALFPGLAGRKRLGLVAADLADLGANLPGGEDGRAFAPGTPPDIPTALGWLYVAEGSTMGAALLRKEAAKLGLSDERGARHLAPASEGPAAHWRAFTARLDAAPIAPEDEERVIGGANAAFARVQAHADSHLG